MTANGQAVAVTPADTVRDRLDDPQVAAALNTLLDHADVLAVPGQWTGRLRPPRRHGLRALSSAVSEFRGASSAGAIPGAEAFRSGPADPGRQSGHPVRSVAGATPALNTLLTSKLTDLQGRAQVLASVGDALIDGKTGAANSAEGPVRAVQGDLGSDVSAASASARRREVLRAPGGPVVTAVAVTRARLWSAFRPSSVIPFRPRPGLSEGSSAWLPFCGFRGGACSGNTMSFLNAEEPNVVDLIVDFGLDLIWHPSLGLELGKNAQKVFWDCARRTWPLDIFVFEGDRLLRPNGTGRMDMFADRPMKDWVTDLAGPGRSSSPSATVPAGAAFRPWS